MSLLEIDGLGLAFDGHAGRAEVLEGIELSVAAGEAVGIVGESGCGKSVLARILLRLNPQPPARVTGGRIRFEGADIMAMNAASLRRLRGRGIGMVFQDPLTYLNPVFTIGQQIGDVLRAHAKIPSAELQSRAIAQLEAVRLPNAGTLLGRYPHELSGGMRQRVLIALALAGNPRLLVADEPTTALDVTIQGEVLALIGELVARLGLTLLLISHDVGVIGAICRRVVVMYAGTIVEDGPAGAVLGRPLHPYTRMLLLSVPDLARPDFFPRGIAGQVPSLRDRPPGCSFAQRCPSVMPICATIRPRLGAAPHRVACHAAAS